jgi:uncharacterized SAM-binding protein YcdF (DUF218 family)
LPVTIYRNPEKLGKAGSLWKGITAGLEENADFILTMDGDGQHRADDIPALVKLSQKKPNCIVLGERVKNASDAPKWRRFANWVADLFLSWACGQRLPDTQSGFRVYPRSLLMETDISTNLMRGFVFESEILIDAATRGYGLVWVSVPAIYSDAARPSHFRPIMDTYFITIMISMNLISRLGSPIGFYRAFFYPALKRIPTVESGHLIPLGLACLVVLGTGGASLVWYIGIIMFRARRLHEGTPNEEPIVVFGVALRNGQVSTDFARRLEKAKNIWNMGVPRKILILGGRGVRDERTEAEEGRKYLFKHGVPDKWLFVEESSHNTLDNLREAKLRLESWGTKTPVLISNRYHLPRCHFIANAIGLKHELLPAEKQLALDLSTGLRLLKESFFLLWFRMGLLWSIVTCGRGVRGARRN